MSDFDENFTTEELNIRFILTQIWLSPRKVFKYINETRYEEYMVVLLVFAGIVRAFDRAAMKNMGDDLSLWAILFICIVLGGLLGWISFYIYAMLVSWTGEKWLNTEGDTSAILRVLSYAMIPSIVALIFLIPQVSTFGIELFKSQPNYKYQGFIPSLLLMSTFLIEAILGIWTLVLSIIAIAEVQKLSIAKAIVNALLPILIIIIFVMAIALIAVGLNNIV